MLREPRIVVIILNWNGIADTLACLESLRHLDYANHEIVVVDQNSTDGSSKAIASAFPDVTLVCNERNLGFAEGNNVGIRHALNRGAAYVVLLNNDTTVEPNFIRTLVDAAVSNPDFDVFGPKIVFDSDPGVIWAAGSHINWKRGTCIQRGLREVDRGQYDRATEVNALTACAMMISRRALDSVGLLDGRFFIYYEETDWCARATRAGFRILYLPGTIVRHRVSSAMGASSPATIYYFVRNNLLFIAKNSRGFRRFWLLCKSLLSALRASCSGLVKGKMEEARVRVRAIAAFLTGGFGKAAL